jgi:ribosomal subunit interface protein
MSVTLVSVGENILEIEAVALAIQFFRSQVWAWFKPTKKRRVAVDIIIQTDGVTLSENLRDAVEEKIGRVEQYAPRALRARVRMRKVSAHANSGQYVVRVLVEVPGDDLSAEQIGPDPMLALDIVSEKIERRLRKVKTERIARRHRKAGSQKD